MRKTTEEQTRLPRKTGNSWMTWRQYMDFHADTNARGAEEIRLKINVKKAKVPYNEWQDRSSLQHQWGKHGRCGTLHLSEYLDEQ